MRKKPFLKDWTATLQNSEKGQKKNISKNFWEFYLWRPRPLRIVEPSSNVPQEWVRKNASIQQGCHVKTN